MDMKIHSFDEVNRLDNELFSIANYEITEGKLIIPKTQEEIYEIHNKIADKFNYYKQMIQSGECSLEFIKWHILDKYGPFPQPKEEINLDDPQCIDEITEWDKIETYIRELKTKENNEMNTIVNNIISSVLSPKIIKTEQNADEEPKPPKLPKLLPETKKNKRQKSNEKNKNKPRD
jgi:hypothetical protein